MNVARLPECFFLGTDVTEISRALLGNLIFTRIGRRGVTGGMIVETEAYGGVDDRASHAFGGRRTARTEVMYRRGGVAYVYLCYGLHSLLNIVTNREGVPHAVLIRAIEPLRGVDIMLRRRGRRQINYTLSSGPGVVGQALGVDRRHSGISVTGNVIWLESGRPMVSDDICAAPRIGVAYAGADAKRLWRFGLKDNPWVSRPRFCG